VRSEFYKSFYATKKENDKNYDLRSGFLHKSLDASMLKNKLKEAKDQTPLRNDRA
jgi:hypothetical protein